MEMDSKATVKVVLKKNALPKIDVQSLRQLLDKSLRKNPAEEKLGGPTKKLKLLDGSARSPLRVTSELTGKTRTISIKTPTRNPYLDKIQLNDGALGGKQISSPKAGSCLKCCFCDFTSTSQEEYQKHIAHHIENRSLRCNLCDFSAEEISAYNAHMKKAHQGKPLRTAYACSVCPYKCLTIESLRSHKAMANHFEKPAVFKCQLCSFSNTDIHQLLDHIVNHSKDPTPCGKCSGRKRIKHHHTLCPEFFPPPDDERFEFRSKHLISCTLCDFKCDELLFLMAHIKAHVKKIQDDTTKEELPFCCTMCDYRCLRPGKLKIHMATHSNGAIFRCKACNYQTKDILYYKIHRKNHSTSIVTCFVCMAKFPQMEDLKKHMTTHWQSEPFACNLCDYVCLTKSRLLLHMDTHNTPNKVLFPCPLCPNKYPTSSSLKDHIRTHSGTRKPLKCESCDYTCFTSELLRIHSQKHVKAEEFSCDLCLSKYPTLAQLKIHMRDHDGTGDNDTSLFEDEILGPQKFVENVGHSKYGYTEENVHEDSDDDDLDDVDAQIGEKCAQ
ncbi:Zinc finger protein [Nesidiocoris tenuis]|uniref:Zinc finger protein n=1 Tax=Nesidiocoris tenuis TaxID=355587 RepID=A0ABN7B186_9HEMI|nr:Zinc finger protein [Nesidiocoris tenuis]